jgi:hypothetical protein
MQLTAVQLFGDLTFIQAREYDAAKDQLRKHGVKVADVYIVPPEEYMIGDTNVDNLMDIIISEDLTEVVQGANL